MMSLEELADFIRTLTDNELEVLYQDTQKDRGRHPYITIGLNVLRHEWMLSMIEAELQLRHLRDVGLRAREAGESFKHMQTKMFIDGVEVGDIIGDIEFQEYGTEPEYKDVDINKELSEFPRLQRFKNDLL